MNDRNTREEDHEQKEQCMAAKQHHIAIQTNTAAVKCRSPWLPGGGGEGTCAGQCRRRATGRGVWWEQLCAYGETQQASPREGRGKGTCDSPHVARRPLGLRICFSIGHDPRVTVVSQVPRDNSDSSSGGVCVRLSECQSCCRCGTSQIRSRATCNDPRGWTVQPSALSLLQTPGEH